jgi:2-C-methyl-D-erythritol 4-phosphate cytidylyltransferase/2-C-methyl-D-erythritol 2,4-cyclodiphosphate synthase
MPGDLERVAIALEARQDRVSPETPELPLVGLGHDLHPFGPGEPLVLGGVVLAGVPRLAGHSDGDAVLHAVADALLGAASLGDVGEHFPESDASLAGIAGPDLLGRAADIARDAGAEAASCDVTVVCDRPAIGPRRAEMRRRVSEALAVPFERVSVKATRPEGLGLTADGVGCIAIVALR